MSAGTERHHGGGRNAGLRVGVSLVISAGAKRMSRHTPEVQELKGRPGRPEGSRSA